MDDYRLCELLGGPADGVLVSFPMSFNPYRLEYWLRGYADAPSMFHVYEKVKGRDRYRHVGYRLESEGAEWSDEMWPQPFAKIKGYDKEERAYGQLSVWLDSQALDY